MHLKYPNHLQSATTSVCDKTIKTEISVFGSQALGAERRRSPSLAVKVLKLKFRKYPAIHTHYS